MANQLEYTEMTLKFFHSDGSQYLPPPQIAADPLTGQALEIVGAFQ